MPARVIDASALAAVLFGEPEARDVYERVRGATLAAPSLLPFEVASVCLKKIRRHPKQRAALLETFALLSRMEIAYGPTDAGAVIQLARETRLTVYDCSYLWLARHLGVELVTLDTKLRRVFSNYR